MLHRISQWLASLIVHERSGAKLAFSFCMGVYIAFSPFVGFHTLMTFALIWFLNLNVAVTFAASCLLHNPWTTIPIYGLDYLVGDWLLRGVCGIDTLSMNPHWMGWVNDTLSSYLGLPKISFWAFMVGGNLLGIFFSVGLYPIMKHLFMRLIEQVHGSAPSRG
jgi:uncharacterized protein (DUF2062 family)